MAQDAFMAPGAYDAEGEAIRRRIAMAKTLQEQGQNPLQGQMIGGHFVAPSITQHLARGLQSYLGRKDEDKAMQDMGALGDTRRAERSDTMTKYADILGRKPQAENAPIDGMGPVLPAVEGGPMAANKILMGSRDPGLQEFGMQQMTTQAAEQAKQAQADALRQKYVSVLTSPGVTPQQAIAAGVPADMVKQYSESKNYGRDEVQWKDVGGQLVPVTKYGDTPSGIGAQAKTATPEALMTDKRTREEGAANRGVTLRGQNLTDSRSRESTAVSLSKPFEVTAPDGSKVLVQQDKAGNIKPVEGYTPKTTGAGGSQLTRERDAKDALATITLAETLIDKATGSGLGNAVDAAAGFFGASTSGAKASAQLKALEGDLVSKMPKMSGPQSDKDVLLYRQMAGQIGDPNVPTATKKAALTTIREIQNRYAGLPAGTPAAPVAVPSVRGGPMQKPVKPASVSNW
jgi:hypothetical protein